MLQVSLNYRYIDVNFVTMNSFHWLIINTGSNISKCICTLSIGLYIYTIWSISCSLISYRYIYRVKHKPKEKDSGQTNKHSVAKKGTRFPKGITNHHLELTETSFRDEDRKRKKMFELIRKAFPKSNVRVFMFFTEFSFGEKMKVMTHKENG